MKEIKIVAWCDNCAADDRKEAATTSVTLTVGPRGAPLTIDLCDTCHEAMITPVTALLTEYGQAENPAAEQPAAVPSPGKKPRPRNRATCPLCPATRSASWVVADHVWRDHVGQPRPAAPTVCPDCGYTAEHTKTPTAAIGRHRANLHGYDPLAEALARYEQTGGSLERKPA